MDKYRDPFDVTWRERVVVLGGMGLVLALGYAIGMTLWPESTLELTGLVPASFFAVGKFLPLWAISGKSNFSPYGLGLVIWIMDTCTALLVVYALEGFYRIRAIKRGLEKIHYNAHLVLKAYPRIRRGAVIGLVLFVLFPIAGTGAVGASFIGILLGMNRFVLIGAVSLGGCLGGFLMAWVAVHFGNALQRFQQMQTDPALKYVFIGAIAVIAFCVVWFLSRAYRKALDNAEKQSQKQQPGDAV